MRVWYCPAPGAGSTLVAGYEGRAVGDGLLLPATGPAVEGSYDTHKHKHTRHGSSLLVKKSCSSQPDKQPNKDGHEGGWKKGGTARHQEAL